MVKLSDTGVAIVLLTPLIFLQMALSIYPMAYSIWMSVTDINLFKGTAEFVGGAQYVKALTDPFVRDSTIVTIRFVAEVTIIVILLGIGVALFLNESFKGRGILRVLVIAPWAISEFATASIGRYLYSGTYGFFNSILLRVGLINQVINFLNTPFTVEFMALLYAWHFAPLVIFFVLAGLQTIPADLYKQAKIDGAGSTRRFRLITFPFIRYAVLMGAILALIEAARTIDVVFVLTGGGPGMTSVTLTYLIYKVFFVSRRLSYGAAQSWILMIGLMVGITAYFLILSRRK